METIQVTVGPHLTMAAFNAMPSDVKGVYLVYRLNKEDGRLKLIYVGKSVDIADRVGPSHEHYVDWIAWAGGQEDRLRFSWVILLDHVTDLLRCEAAIIYSLRPPINRMGIDTFSYDDTMIIFNGREVCCRSQIIAKKTI